MKEQDDTFALGTQFRACLPARDQQEVRERHAANRAGWNRGAAWYTRTLDEAIAFLRGGGSTLHPIEREHLGDLRAWCDTAVHLQCASGQDTLSLWNEGVRQVIGIDISDRQIANARRMSAALGSPAVWYRCDVLDTPPEVQACADLVYTGRGALCWLHDLERWAEVVFRLLKPGAILHLFDEHPVAWLFNPDAETWEWSGVNYFAHCEGAQTIGWLQATEDPEDEQDGQDGQSSPVYERLWPLATVFQALRRAGLVVEHLGEYPDSYWNCFPSLRPEVRGQVPLTFAMVARRPA